MVKKSLGRSAMNAALYDKIGKTYDATRKPDTAILQTLLRLLAPLPRGRYLDVGCGSGNYTQALWERGVAITGIDISEEMLSKARPKNSKISWRQGDAKKLQFQDASFDGAICTFATHHMGEFEQAFKEVYRVLKAGNFVILTATPEQMQHYWLHHYFPAMMQHSGRQMSSLTRIKAACRVAGFTNIRTEPFFVTRELTDLFLYAGKYRPGLYFDAGFRAGVSAFHVSANQQEITEGLDRLKADIDSGKIHEVIADSETEEGDCLFVAGEKLDG